MRLHEYQARELLSGAGVPVPASDVVTTSDEAVAAYKRIGGVEPNQLRLLGESVQLVHIEVAQQRGVPQMKRQVVVAITTVDQLSELVVLVA